MHDLRLNQHEFWSLFELLIALGEKKFRAHAAVEVANCALAVEPFEVPDANGLSEIDDLRSDAMHRGKWPSVYTAGHSVACRVFELFPSRLVPYPGGAAELPRRVSWSVLSEAMFMLKKDYELSWKWSFCKNQRCQRAFRRMRTDQTCCDTFCVSVVRSHKYYHWRGHEVRRARLAAKKAVTKPN
jgi:hypothetical protein